MDYLPLYTILISFPDPFEKGSGNKTIYYLWWTTVCNKIETCTLLSLGSQNLDLLFPSLMVWFTSISADEKEEYDATGAKIYLESCETLGIIPASYFLRTLQAQEPQICMSHHGVGPKGAKAIAVALTVSLINQLLKLFSKEYT